MRFGVKVDGPAAGAAPADLLRRMDRKPRAACGHAACAGFSRLSRRRFRWRASMASGARRARAEEGRQRADARCSAGGRSIPSTSGSAAFTACPTRAELRRWRTASKQARELAIATRALGRRASTFPISSATTSSWRCATRTNIRSTKGGIVSNRGIDIDIADYESEFEERHVAHSTALQSVREAARQPIWSGRWRAIA